jgi:predicted secreted protein
MASNVVNGTDVCLFMEIGQVTGSTTGTTLEVVALSTGCKINIQNSTIKTSSKDSGKFESSIAGRFSYTIDGDGFYSTDADASRITYDQLMGAFLSGKTLTVTIGQTTGVLPQVKGSGKMLVGKVIITKFDADFKDQSAATFSISMEGVDALTYS